MTTENASIHQDNCLMCAVRALTSGDPEIVWTPETEGQMVSGVVLRQGTTETLYGQVPFVDLWMGGTARTRVVAHSAVLRGALEGAAPEIGDTLSIWYEGRQKIEQGPRRDRLVRRFRAAVRRGH